jgi:adenylate cyclase class 2
MPSRRPKQHVRDRSLEAELKFRLTGSADHARLRARLRQLGAQTQGAYDEENIRLVVPPKSRVSLRLRVIDGSSGGILTTKGPARYVRGIKVREETEVGVEAAGPALDLLLTLGYTVDFTFHKHRASFLLDGVTVTLDTLDFGFFSELEGPVEAIPGVAAQLGLNPKQSIRESYSAMAKEHLLAARKAAAKP